MKLLDASVILGALLLGACAARETRSTTTVTAGAATRARDAADVVQELRGAVPDAVIHDTRCVVVLPSTISGGLFVGAEHGKGYAMCRTSSDTNAWSAPAPVTLSSGTLGPQIGVQSVDLLLLVMSDEAKDKLFRSKFELGGDVAAAAGPVGKGKGENFNRRAGVLSYSRAQGLYAGVDLTGAVIHQDAEATFALYGSRPPLASVLAGQLPVPASSEPFVRAISDAFRF